MRQERGHLRRKRDEHGPQAARAVNARGERHEVKRVERPHDAEREAEVLHTQEPGLEVPVPPLGLSAS